MTERATQTEWILFVILGLAWGSSYLFIKIAVDDFGTFTLIALRLGIGAAFLWTVARLSHVTFPREPRLYGHLVVMAIVNIVFPFALITWAEQSVDSAVASILNSTVPLWVIIIAPFFLHDEPIRVNGLVGLAVGFLGVVVLTSRGLTGVSSDLAGEIALLGSSLCYAIGGVYARRNVRGVRPMIPAVIQVTFALVITATIALLFEHPLDSRPAPDAVFAVVWLGLLGSGLAFVLYFRLLSRWGATRTSMVAYLLPIVGIVLGFLVLGEPIDARLILGTVLVVAGVGLVNSRFGRRRLFGRVPPIEAV
ncbi:MAG: hypothetical protein A2Z32_13675 [Chloroflexi bacterium RBG_16_69_14]|nr:MAG: hypothetical protein A2Z32_13675 [Chloroflexi bacterium RBG_16_69_14]